MELINATRLQAAYTMGMEPSGRELLVVAIKGTFRLPANPQESARLLDDQQPLVMADIFHGEPGLSAPLYEVDFAPRKQACDILLNASAWAPSRVAWNARQGRGPPVTVIAAGRRPPQCDRIIVPKG